MSSDQLYVPRARFRPELFLFALRDAVCALGHQDEHSLPVSAASVLDSSCQQFVLASTILDVPGSSPLDSGSNSSKQNAHAHLVRQAAAWQAHCNETVSPGSPFLAVMRELVTSIKDDPHSPLPLASSAAKATGARAPGTSLFSSHESPLNRWVLLSFFPLVRAVQLVADHAGVTLNLHADVLGLLVAVLRDVPPFAFASEPADNMDTVQTMLLNQAALEVDPNRKCSVMSAVLALATQRGSLAPLLHVACELVKEHASSSKTGGPEFFIDAGPSISHLFEHCSPSVGVIAHPAALLSRFSVDHVAKDISLHVPKSAQDTSDADPLVLAPVRDWRRAVLLPAEYASQAVLGGFLFRHTRTGLTKVGTGVDGTITGLVYAHRADFMPQTVCSLVVIGHRLFIGFAGCASLAVEVHVDTLLETGCVLHPPAESGAAHDQSRMFSYGSQLFLFRVASAVDVCVERFNCPTQTELSPNLARSCPSIPLQFPWSHVTNLSQFSVAHLPSVIDALGLLFDGRLIHVVVPARFISEAMLSTLATSFTAPMLPTENQIRSIQAVQLRFDASKGSFQGVSILRVSPDSGPSRTLVCICVCGCVFMSCCSRLLCLTACRLCQTLWLCTMQQQTLFLLKRHWLTQMWCGNTRTPAQCRHQRFPVKTPQA